MSVFAAPFVIGHYSEVRNVDSMDKAFFSWGSFVVRLNDFCLCTSPLSDIYEKMPYFCIVDNLDKDGFYFLVKDVRIHRPILLEKNNDSQTFCVRIERDRSLLESIFFELNQTCQEVYLVCSTTPFELVKVN